MSDKNLRESTKKVRENQIKRSEIEADIKKQKKKSKALQKQIREEESVLLEEALQLAEYTVEHFETSSEESGVAGEEVPGHTETFDDKSDSSYDEWDPLGVIKTPRKLGEIEGTELAEIPSASWSTKVNQFFPLDCESTPTLERREIITSVNSGPLSPALCLEKIIEESIHSEAGEDEVLADSHPLNKETSDTFDKSEEIREAMDDDDYKTRLAEVQKSVVKTHLRIDEFSPDIITIEHRDTYNGVLAQVRKHLEATRDLLYELVTDLDPDHDAERITQLKKIDKKVTDSFKANEKSVMEVMGNLKAAADSAAKTAENMKEEKAAGEKKAKFEIRIQKHLKKTKSLRETIEAIGDCAEMSEQTIRKNLLESKEWEKKLDSLLTAKDTIDEETVNLTFDSNIKSELESEFNMLLDTVEEKVKELNLIDSKLGLHTLAPSKVKENVVYPEPFKGAPGEDVYKFVKEFKEAIAADHVRTNDEVKTLLKYLKEGAKKTVGEHHKTLEDALTDLKSSYGNPQWIWQTLKEDFEKKVHFRAWGKPFTYERLNTMNTMLDFMRRAEALADQHKNLHEVVYSPPTIAMLKNLLPNNYLELINRQISLSHSNKDKMWRIQAFLEAEKDSTLIGIPDKSIYDPKKSHPDNPKAQYGSRHGKNRQTQGKGHDCSSSNQCITKWDKFGCIEVYKLATVEERRQMLISIKMCYRCGAPFTPGVKPDGTYIHKCKWNRDKHEVRCQGQNGPYPCSVAAAMCLVHKNNASGELRF